MAFLLFLVPFVNVLMIFLIIFQMAKVFGKGFLFGLGLLFLPVISFRFSLLETAGTSVRNSNSVGKKRTALTGSMPLN